MRGFLGLAVGKDGLGEIVAYRARVAASVGDGWRDQGAPPPCECAGAGVYPSPNFATQNVPSGHFVRWELTFCPGNMAMSELLDRLGWSQAYFARHVGVSEKTVSRWCKVGPDPVAMKYLELVVRMLGC